MNNDRGQSLHIPSITSLKENNIYVATLHFNYYVQDVASLDAFGGVLS